MKHWEFETSLPIDTNYYHLWNVHKIQSGIFQLHPKAAKVLMNINHLVWNFKELANSGNILEQDQLGQVMN